MIKKMFSMLIVLGFAAVFLTLVLNFEGKTQLDGVGASYVEREPEELGAMNIITAIIVTYRGLDTLGEVAVLFIAATGIAVLLRRRKNGKSDAKKEDSKRDSSEILKTGVKILAPMILMFGAYIFMNGHLTPGGGFQGGAVVATAVLLLFLAEPSYKINHTVFSVIESLSGTAYVIVGLLGMFLAGGFLDNRILPLGEFGTLLSAGTIPLIYTFIGLKVGTELAGILDNLKGNIE